MSEDTIEHYGQWAVVTLIGDSPLWEMGYAYVVVNTYTNEVLAALRRKELAVLFARAVCLVKGVSE